jgi:hypothetical protein
VAAKGISRLRFNGRLYDDYVRMDAEALTRTLKDAMDRGTSVELALADNKGKPCGGTLVIHGRSLTDFTVNGVPPMDYPQP